MAAINVFVVLSGIVFVIFLLGFHDFLTNNEENGCEMTYMFEYPQFVRIALPVNIARRYSRYGLYAYGEGHFTERLREMKFNGIPVLFIPGNSGSYKQVRSLASVSLRKTLKAHSPFHFDYFAVDLNEEYSALFGGVLKDQKDFVHYCLHRILRLYKDNLNKPSSVILIGHSMDLVQVIITLVSPHRSPVLSLDFYVARYYAAVNGYWKQNRGPGIDGNLSHVTFVSIGGGHRDSTAIPDVWLSTDHLCSVWCKELVLVLVRSLFDIVNLTTKQVSENLQERNSVFQYHLSQRTAGKRFSLAHHPREVNFDRNAVWNEYLQRQFTIHEPYGIHTETHIMIRLLDDPKHEMLSVEAINIEDKDWVFVCIASSVYNGVRINTGINLSNETKFLPSRLYKRKMVHLNMTSLKKQSFTHVVLRIKPTREMVMFKVDVHSASSRQLTVPLPKWLSFMSKPIVLDLASDLSSYYELSLPGFESAWQAYLLHIQPKGCKEPSHHTVATMTVPWSQNVQKPMRLKLQSPKPPSFNESKSVKVTLVLDPTCRYTISPMLLPYLVAILLLTLRHQLLTLEESGQCVMFHTALGAGAKPYYILPAAKISSRILGFLARTLTGTMTFSEWALAGFAKLPAAVAAFLIALNYRTCGALSLCVGSAFFFLKLCKMYEDYLEDLFKYSLRLILGRRKKNETTQKEGVIEEKEKDETTSNETSSTSVEEVKAIEDNKDKKEIENEDNKDNKDKKETENEDKDKDCKQESGDSKCTTSLENESTNDAAAIVPAAEPLGEGDKGSEVAEQAGKEEVSEVKKEYSFSEMHFNFTALLLWLCVTLLNVPCVLVWAHNYKYDVKLEPDPSFEISLILCFCVGILWQGSFPKPNL
ncbi:hypothetical protein C0J52_10314 [Blattella germanica]|nr:hypothetical protein C0J52_10314 [Blattella germanica]